MEIKLIRYDLTKMDEELIESNLDDCTDLLRDSEIWPNDRASCITQFALPIDSIIKVYYEGHLIPWSLIAKCPSVEIQVYRPNQNVKPRRSQGCVTATEELIREKVSRLESRIASLEAVVNPETIEMKTDRDLQLLTKQITFLSRRLDEADQAEWIKKT
ncbi:unnamed protein product [Orchesella dallaii]|uniref:Uncharacterized protein n=1 Tax=Orchesella dallaii TaxID=48710 RepID=A0ABP1QNV9_9HEXA